MDSIANENSYALIFRLIFGPTSFGETTDKTNRQHDSIMTSLDINFAFTQNGGGVMPPAIKETLTNIGAPAITQRFGELLVHEKYQSYRMLTCTVDLFAIFCEHEEICRQATQDGLPKVLIGRAWEGRRGQDAFSRRHIAGLCVWALFLWVSPMLGRSALN